MDAIELSSYGRASSAPAPVNRMMAEFASDFRDGVDINLGVGYVNEDTIPVDDFRLALDEVLAHPGAYRQPFNYGGAAGAECLLAAIRRFLLGNAVGGLTAEALTGREIIIGANGATSLLESLAYVLPPGIVITADPVYYIYTHFLQRRGFELLAVPEDAAGPRTDLLARKLDALGPRIEKVRFLYVVTVNNPTCTILSNARRRELVATAARLSRRLGRGVPVIFDRAYEELIHDPAVPAPVSSLLDDAGGVVYEVGTLSKVLAPALRIGYMIGRGGPFLRAMVQRTSDAGFSASEITQAMASWLLDHRIADQLARVRAGYREKARAVGAWLGELLGEHLEAVTGGQAGFYFYLTFRDVETHEGSALFRALTRTTGEAEIDGPPGEKRPRVIYVPGEHCTASGGDLAAVGRRQLRLSYAFEDLDAIHAALKLMRDAINHVRRT